MYTLGLTEPDAIGGAGGAGYSLRLDFDGREKRPRIRGDFGDVAAMPPPGPAVRLPYGLLGLRLGMFGRA